MFTEKHLIGLGVALISIAVLIVVFYFTLKNKSMKVKLIPAKILAIALLVIEFMKFMYLFWDGQGITEGNFPLHLCSMFLWAFPVALFTNNRFTKYAKAFSYIMGIPAGLMVLLIPSSVLDSTAGWMPISENILDIHSFVYHAILIFVPLYVMIIGAYRPTVKNCFQSYAVAVGCGVVALLCNLYVGDGGWYMLGSAGNNGEPLDTIMEYTGFGGYLPIFAIILLAYNFVTWVPFGIYTGVKKRIAKELERKELEAELNGAPKKAQIIPDSQLAQIKKKRGRPKKDDRTKEIGLAVCTREISDEDLERKIEEIKRKEGALKNEKEFIKRQAKHVVKSKNKKTD